MNLVNILISLCISLLVTSGTFQWYCIVKKNWEKNEKQKIDPEIQQILFQFYQQDIQTAGYQGCRTRDKSFPLYKIYSDYTAEYRYFNFDHTIFSFLATPGSCFGRMPNTACERILENTPVLILYNVPKGLTQLKHPLRTLSDPLMLKNYPQIQEKSLVLISDCQQGDLFIASKIEGATLHHKKMLGMNSTGELSKLYGEKGRMAEVAELQTVAYYLGKPERLTDSYSLYRDDFLHPAQEVATGIVEIQLSFGIMVKNVNAKIEDSNENTKIQSLKENIKPSLRENTQSTLVYKTANEIQNWDEVKSVHIQITTETGKIWQTHVTPRNRHGPPHRHVSSAGHFKLCNASHYRQTSAV